MNINERIATFGKAQSLLAVKQDEKAEAARRDMASGLGAYLDPQLKAMERQRLEREASQAERMAAVYRRRAEFASRGYLLQSPSEIVDSLSYPDTDLVTDASRAGLLYCTEGVLEYGTTDNSVAVR